MAVTPIVLTPTITTVEFGYSTDLMEDDGMGTMIVNVAGFPPYITFDSDPTKLTYKVEDDSLMVSGDVHPI